ncbi:hypothetical protein CCR87_10825 [Rhodobaculum claviforme]|uniref:Uncharacterized protein n=1 Tax=Rhodobaculum claviforme TaxID=1549854 RepID=A0A934TKH2_9RHOB|nr:hypothetical protein [Rhodobaculum claviforme]
MIFVVTPDTVSNPRALLGGSPPRKILTGLRSVFPARLMLDRIWWRLALEYPLLRYSFALSPFPAAILIWPDLALPISGAPLLMFLFINFIEGNVLSISDPDRRRRLLPEDEVARRRDLLESRARAVLTRLAAGRDMADGEITLVVEQSPMAPVPPLTVISVQTEVEGAPVVALDAQERAMVTEGLFDDFHGAGKLTERCLHRLSLRENRFLHAVTLDARTISAHARMAALARARAAGPDAQPARA